jgi:uncharacterized protein YukE
MPSQVVQMDYPIMSNVSQRFMQAHDTLVQIGNVLQTVMNGLRAVSFTGAALVQALLRYLEVIKQRVDRMAAMCREFSEDIARAVNDHRNGQYRAGSYFGEGLR